MFDREKTVRIVKLSLRILLRVIGCWLLLGICGQTADFLYTEQEVLYGVADFVGSRNVIYTGDLWDYIYTNPGAMMGRHLLFFLAVTAGVCLLSLLVTWGMQKGKLFLRAGKFDQFLIAALFFSILAWVLCGGRASQACFCAARRRHEIKACQTREDHEKLLGHPLWEGVVQEKDREWIKALGSFEKCECLPAGFVPGRKLVIFGMKRPRVYILLWMENGKAVGRNGCYQSVPLPQGRCGPPHEKDRRNIEQAHSAGRGTIGRGGGR